MKLDRPDIDKTKLVRTQERSPSAPLDDPPFLAADEALWPIDEVVLGIEYYGVAKAYPTSMLWLHQAVNDLVYFRPVLISFCGLSSSGVVFDVALSRKERLTFKPYGVYQGALVLRDDQTKSLWSHLDGCCLAGKLAGHQLKQLPAAQVSWAQWRRWHPDTLVLSNDTPYHDRYRPLGMAKARLGSGYRMYPSDWKPGLQPEALVLGLRTEEGQWAYPLAELAPMANAEVGGRPVVIFHDRLAEHAIVFWREIEGDELSFADVEGEIRDKETGSTWSQEGRCLKGPLEGRSLAFVPSVTVEWYAWSAHYPNTHLIGPAWQE